MLVCMNEKRDRKGKGGNAPDSDDMDLSEFARDPMRFGYARVSTHDQNLDLQIEALTEAGCDQIEQETASTRKKRGLLWELLRRLQKGDTLTVWRFDRLARSVAELVEITEAIRERGAHLVSLTENIDTSTSAGTFVFHSLASVAQFERDLIRERTLAGLATAKAKGKVGGRPKALTRAQIALAVELRDEKNASQREIARGFKVSQSTIQSALADHDATVSLAEAGHANGELWILDKYGLPVRQD